MSRYLDVRAFCEEAKKLKVVSGIVDARVLERLEEQRSLLPRLRIRYPDTVERRWWAEAHPEYPVHGKQEGETSRWIDACTLEKLRQRDQWPPVDPITNPHPLDDPHVRFRKFIQRPARRKFVKWADFSVNVSSEHGGTLHTDRTAVTYYTSWQILLFAEVVNMGVTVFLNLLELEGWPSETDMANAPKNIGFLPIHAMRGFKEHERALDAIVWFAEEQNLGFNFATRADHRRRIVAADEASEIARYRIWAAMEAKRLNRVSFPSLLAATKFLAEQWAHWHSEGRPLIAAAYKSMLAHAVRLACLIGKMEYPAFRDKIGKAGGYFKPILDVVWPDWAAEQRDDARRILVGYRRPDALLRADFDDALVERFLDFIEEHNLHGFYWRLESFHRHAFKGNDHALTGLKADVQGMAVVLEHIATALGATRTQLRDKFKELWMNDAAILKALKDNGTMKIGDGKTIDLDWFESRQGLDEVAETAADLAISYAIRGGAHRVIAESNPLKLERMMLILLRAAVKTFRAAANSATSKLAA